MFIRLAEVVKMFDVVFVQKVGMGGGGRVLFRLCPR